MVWGLSRGYDGRETKWNPLDKQQHVVISQVEDLIKKKKKGVREGGERRKNASKPSRERQAKTNTKSHSFFQHSDEREEK